MSTWVGEGRAESGGSAPQLRCYIEGRALAAAYAGTGAMTHLHAKKPDNVRVIQPGERSHLLAGRVHHDRRRDLDGNACETAPGHRQLRQRQLARAVSACTQRKAPQTTKIVAGESCEHSHSPVCTCCPRRTAPWAPEPKSLPHATEPSESRTPASNHRGEHTHPISVPSIRYRPSGVKYWLELAPSLQLSGCIGRQRRWRYGLRSCF